MRGRSSRRSARKARRFWRSPTRPWPELRVRPGRRILRCAGRTISSRRSAARSFRSRLTVDATPLARRSALVYVRAIRRPVASPDRRRQEREPQPGGAEAAYPVDAIFPGRPDARVSRCFGRGGSRISRGFSVAPGEYEVIVVMRERVDPATPRARPKAAVLRQPLSVPDFRTSELTTSSIIVADRIAALAEPVPADQLAERPYVVGRNDITPAVGPAIRAGRGADCRLSRL